MITRHALGVFALCGDRGHLQRGGIAREYAGGCDDRLEFGEQRALGIQNLDDRLDHHVAGGEVGEYRGNHQPVGRGLHCVGRHPALFGEALPLGGDGLLCLCRSAGAAVEQESADSGLRCDLGNAAAHHAGADDRDAQIRARNV